VPVDRADAVGLASGCVFALVDAVGDGDGPSGADAGVVGPVDGAGDVPELDCDGCAQPVNDIAVAMSANTTNRIRFGISGHLFSTPWTSGRLAWVPFWHRGFMLRPLCNSGFAGL
jgi:hypothetical protein